MAISKRLRDYLNNQTHKTPFLVVDMDKIKANYENIKRFLPIASCYYSVKSNCSTNILKMLNNQNSSFEVASLGELRACIAAGVSANDIHFGNTIKTVENIKIAYALGVKSYAIDCEQELFKVAHNAPESSVICRITTDGVGATWGLCNKFGTSVEQTAELLLKAKKLGANKIGVSFHVGSQQKSPDAWRRALLDVKIVYDILAKNNVSLDIINLGGGFPAPGYLNTSDEQVNYSFQEYGCAINDYIQSIFVDYSNISFMCEPGRYLLAEAGCIKSQVVLRSDKLSEGSLSRWLYLDVGKFNGLYEATDIKHPIIYDPKHDAELVPTILSGPTCDSDDMLSLKNDYHKLPENINTGDFLIFASTGAYSNSYASVGFNGIPPLTEFYI